MSNFSSKMKVEIDAPEHGWTRVKLDSENGSYQFFPSDIPIDSISELVKAILEILNGNNQSKVYWNDEPVEHNFIFTVENEVCYFKVYEVFESVAGRNLEERFSFRGTKYEVLRPFWKALCEMKSKQSLDEYEKHWGNAYPTNEMLEIKQKLKSLK
jgi:hypothetical protein